MSAPGEPAPVCSGCGKPMTRWWWDEAGRAFCAVCAKARRIIQ